MLCGCSCQENYKGEREKEREKGSKGAAKKGRRSGENSAAACSSELGRKDTAKTFQLYVGLDGVGRSVGRARRKVGRRRRFEEPFLDLPISVQRRSDHPAALIA